MQKTPHNPTHASTERILGSGHLNRYSHVRKYSGQKCSTDIPKCVRRKYDDDIRKAGNQRRYRLDTTGDVESDRSSHNHVALQDAKKKAVSQSARSSAQKNIKPNITKRTFQVSRAGKIS
jgi:hypothetical protein